MFIKNEPRIQTLIPVKAGGKNDPASSTGLAHYLEHMMFKGTDKFGTKDWETEKPLLDSIEHMFETYRSMKDPAERKAWYAKIDALSNEASKYAIANEYDKMVQFIGAKYTNAYTSTDRTVYMNDIPSNQLENWLEIESERFSKIVNRLFHTELETVYEEKNRSLDNDGSKVYEGMLAMMFEKHKYGKQTVIGTIEHLKNPSITDIVAYFNKYYVPNNMAVCLSGDLDIEETIQLVNQYFGRLKAVEFEPDVQAVEAPVTQNRELTVYGPDAENLLMGFRFGGSSSKDFIVGQMVDMLLNNSTAGLMDLNLVQKQKVLDAGCFIWNMNDYSMHLFRGNPREGQTLEEVRDLILEQIELVKQGDFEDWLIEAIINDFKKVYMSGLESNYNRCNEMISAFTTNMTWQEKTSFIDQMEALTKEEIVAFANEKYQNYGIVYKLTGEDPNKQQVEKPVITKVDVDRDTQSPFFETVSNNVVATLTPKFINYEEELDQFKMKSDIPVMYKQNEENELFSLYYLLESGTNEDQKIQMALEYLKYLGTNTKSPDDVKKEFYKLGCSFDIFASNDRVYVMLNGLSDQMEDAMILFEDLLKNPKGDEDVLSNLKSDSHKSRSDDKKSKNTIMWGGLRSYLKYGAENPFNNVLDNETLNAASSEELIDIITSIQKTDHKVMYYGPISQAELKTVLNKQHQVPYELVPAKELKKFTLNSSEDPKVYWSHYDMVQAEILFQQPGEQYDAEVTADSRIFNEYVGGMSGIAFQEIREAQGLAYSVFAGYSQAKKVEEHDVFNAYVGTQADKQAEAMEAMLKMLNDLPESEMTFNNAKKAILESIESERITKSAVFFNYLDAQNKELDYDIRKDVYDRVKAMSIEDLMRFHEEYIKGNNYNIALIGDREKLNFAALSDYGQVKELSLDEIFGYKERVVDQNKETEVIYQ